MIHGGIGREDRRLSRSPSCTTRKYRFSWPTMLHRRESTSQRAHLMVNYDPALEPKPH